MTKFQSKNFCKKSFLLMINKCLNDYFGVNNAISEQYSALCFSVIPKNIILKFQTKSDALA